MKTNFFSIFLVIFFKAVLSFADSPITSTFFSKAYLDVEIVEFASQSDGILDKKMCKYLSDKKVNIDYKLAMINALSWDFDGKNNFDIYLSYIIKKNKKITENNYKNKCNADQLICLAYLKALDNYFQVDEALEIAKLAAYKNKDSYSVQIIFGLIKAQYIFDYNWCEVYKATNEVRQNENLKKDMREEAISIIFEYMDLYKDEC
ncbi:MAG: hypothetical protein JXL97_11415 [Bacteroidales bacterium]|nr:hypothetical protein [Bacteroidales bacterium]